MYYINILYHIMKKYKKKEKMRDGEKILRFMQEE